MFDRAMLCDTIYALAARDGREAVLFGQSAAAVHNAFVQSAPGDAFPELWFELPLAGSPWLDVHVLTSRESLSPTASFTDEETGGHANLFAWFAAAKGVRQLALSWDSGSIGASEPAVQLLVSTEDPRITCSFLEAAGRSDAVASYKAFRDRLPHGWFACYVGVFPERSGMNLRVECIPVDRLQRAYAEDPPLLERDLRQVGWEASSKTAVERSCLFAQNPFQIEFQFDVCMDGSLGETFATSARFACPPGSETWAPFEVDGYAGRLMKQLEEWGLADERWRLLGETVFAKRASQGSQNTLLYCYPAFIKCRWRSGEPLDAKAYLIAGVQPC